MKIYLLRHGESAANVDRVFAAKKVDPPLAETGVKQIKNQAECLKTVRFEAVYSSPLLRARQTAEIVCRANGLDYRIDDSLREVDVGTLDGQSEDDPKFWAVYENTVAQWQDEKPGFAFPGGESAEEVTGRFTKLLDRIEGLYDGPVLLVGHCLLYMTVLWYWYSDRKDEVEKYHMGRGNYSIVNKENKKLDLIEFNVGPF